MAQKALVLGASGRFGRHAADALQSAGWEVAAFNRATDDLMSAVEGVDVIVNGWNPPYTKWAQDIPEMTTKVIAAAQASQATVVIPGNVYVFGSGSNRKLSSTTPHRAKNSLGRIRIEMEAAYRASGVKTIVLRGGDFLDTSASGNWFDKIIVANAPKGRVVSPGEPDVPHAWAHLPDMARAMVGLVEKRAELDTYEDVPFPGHTLSLREICALVSEASGRAQHLKRMNWLPLYVAAPFWPMGRRLLEMRYLWSMPHELDAERFKEMVPGFHSTDALTVVRHAIAHLDIDPN